MYRVGDLVRFRSDLLLDCEYGGLIFFDDMLPFVNKEVVIVEVDIDTEMFRVKDSKLWFSFEMINKRG